CWMAVEVSAAQSDLPRPVVLGGSRGMHAYVSAARLDIALEAILLRWIQDIPGRTQKDDGRVTRQVLLIERGRVLRRIDHQSFLEAELANCGDSVWNRAMTKCGRLGEDEHARLLRVCRNRD